MTSTLPELPNWPETPVDKPAAIREAKAALRARIEASGRSVDEVFQAARARVLAKVDQIKAAKERGEQVWPEIEYADLAAGRVTDEQIARIKDRGCLIVRNQFDRERATGWDREIIDYVDRNDFFTNYRGPGDDFFATVGSKPEIYPIYWSVPQMEARQSDEMATVQAFLNRLWTYESEGQQWFDPTRDSLYPDRIRRRPPGTNSGGLGHHLDTGTLDLWLTEDFQRAFRHVFDGTIEQYDPWDATHRTDGHNYQGSTMCSAFRTFQGWTALSDMDHDQGVLHTVPIPEALSYLLLRALLDDVPDDDLCGVDVARTFPVNEKWHAELLDAVAGIPDVKSGDTVWWHCDMVHSVAPVTDQKGWGNVMYIPAAPWCPRNERYAEQVRTAFETGKSPSDFPEEDYEVSWDRFCADQLNRTGRRGLGME